MFDSLRETAKNIKIMAFDVDGVMTNGSLTFDENGVEYKTYNAKDGQGIQLLHKAGIIPAIITKRKNGTVQYRAKILCIKEFHEGVQDKLKVLQEIAEKYNVSTSEISYMGDDVPDVCVLKEVGLPCCPKDAVDEVKNYAKFVIDMSSYFRQKEGVPLVIPEINANTITKDTWLIASPNCTVTGLV